MTDAEKTELIATTIEAPDASEIRPDVLLVDLPEWDSMGIMNTVIMLDTRFGRDIDYKELMRLVTVGDLMALMA